MWDSQNHYKYQSVVPKNATVCILRNGQRGECTQIGNCKSAIFKLRQNGSPEYCGYEDELVCCPEYIKKFQAKGPGDQTPRNHVEDTSVYVTETVIYDSSSNYETLKIKKGQNDRDADDFEILKKTSDILPSEKINKDDSEENIDLKSRRNRHGYYDVRHFVPPGLSKKKPWTDGNNEYYYEYVTKKPNGQRHQGPNKYPEPNGGGNYAEWGIETASRRPAVWYGQEDNFNGGHRQTPYSDIWSTTKRSTRYPSIQVSTTPQYHYSVNQQYNGNQHYNGNQQYNVNQYYNGNQQFNGNQQNNANSFGQNPNINFWGQRPTTAKPINNYNPQPSSQHFSRPEGNRPGNKPHSEGLTMSERKCLEYSKEVTENITGLPLTTNPNPVVIPIRKCIQPHQLIVGGENTTLGEFPHMAAIGFRGRNNQGIVWNCGGTLISEQFVLTAAHCTSTSSGRPVKVRLGEYNLMKNDDGAHPVDYAIAEIITHPEYKPPSKYHDIALLRLSRRVKFYKHIRPACLYLDETLSLTKAIATGWGRMFYDGNVSEVLQKVVLSIVDNKTCNRLYKVNVKTEVLSRGIVDSQLCAGELSGGKDTCQGDSGGPLSITSTKCIHHIVGITSFGKSCALPNSTGVYTKVSAYVPWIESIVWPQE
ncbi:hypothetical protein RUM43_007344 [Polyplax serrata]|uniref:Peptidase S1 domain-containing protein n=1 Tax=Polyplax serrata TaxID=468196 RepID=A0AAN8P5N7_POLSC